MTQLDTRPGRRQRPVVAPAPLLVCPNPYQALDHQGRPAGLARLDPGKEHSAGQRIYIGARLGDVQVLEKRGPGAVSAGLAPTVQVHFWDFETDAATPIADTPYHRQLLEHGAVLAWDEPTHTRIFGRREGRPFVEPAKVLKKSRADAIELWKQEHDGEAPIFVEEELEAESTTKPPAEAEAAPEVVSAPNDPTTAGPKG